ncbi:MAG: hypothetical protein KAZ28_06845 [Bacteroidaceae bacterium]|nr:hypothetical protein [Bacteroidaceae bacterium]
MTKINTIPIHWFGDRVAYNRSKIRIVTVGLNPSDKEFRNNNRESFNIGLRFQDYEEKGLEAVYNNYFEYNPYSWFKSFECILNGLDASYYSEKGMPNRVLHTDICSPWATDPTWSKLPNQEKKNLMENEHGFEQWKQLIRQLKPDIILFSIPEEYIKKLDLENERSVFVTISNDKKGVPRKKSVVIEKGVYGRSLAIFGRTWNVPFGALGEDQKKDLGQKIEQDYIVNK